jgi:uncharacterized protein (DUF302 family)
MAVRDNRGMVTLTSSHDYPTTLARLAEALADRELTVFALIDHAAGARVVGMDLPDETVVVFGNPRAGTPLMRDDARIGIELPLRMLVWDSGEGIRLGWGDPRALADTYDVAAHDETLAAMAALLQAVAGEVAA